jgi:AcrR family transcriptional regulator
MDEERGNRRRRANGEASRRKILAAAAEVAGERGYDGTSIALVSKQCGLPASSIYWHFKDKDELIAAVIEHSFQRWLAAAGIGDSRLPDIADLAGRIAKALLDTPDFLRLGLMLTLERRPEEPSARAMFLRVRALSHERLAAAFAELVPDLDDDAIRLLTTYAIAGADGLFIAHEIGGDAVELVRLFEFHARVLLDTATRLLREADRN